MCILLYITINMLGYIVFSYFLLYFSIELIAGVNYAVNTTMPSGIVFNPNNHDIVFLSYDEPNADTNYQHLLSIKPKAMRVDGIKGSDAAHKACAELAKTERVIIIDGDNHVLPTLWHHNVYTKTDFDWTDHVFSWSSFNTVNHTSYGNGGIKCWPVHLLKSMRTHEAGSSIDFDLNNYLELNKVASHTVINSSARQAFRAGFRDGVKLSLIKDDWRTDNRLYNWMHIGADVEFGLWAIYGARLGRFMLQRGLELSILNDLDELNSIFAKYSGIAGNALESECNKLGNLLGIGPVLSSTESMQFKQTYIAPMRSPELFTGGDRQDAINKFNERI